MGCLCFPPIFLTDYFKDFHFLIYIIQCQETFKKDYFSTISTYHGNSKKRFHLKDTTKNPIKTMDISSLLNTDLCTLNGSNLILQDDRFSMYNTIYIFLKITCPIGKKTEAYMLIKTKAFFQNQRFGQSNKKKAFGSHQ